MRDYDQLPNIVVRVVKISLQPGGGVRNESLAAPPSCSSTARVWP